MFKQTQIVLYKHNILLFTRKVNNLCLLLFIFKEFSNLIVWSTLNKGPFIALEPWSGLSTSLEEGDRLEDKKDVRILKPGQVDHIGFDIEIL